MNQNRMVFIGQYDPGIHNLLILNNKNRCNERWTTFLRSENGGTVAHWD